MNKLINSSESQSQQLPIVAGNDFSINVVITELDTETGSWNTFVLTAEMSPSMYLVSSNGKRINTKATLENDGSLTAEIPGYYLTKSAYGVEILFVTEGRNRRTYAPDLFKIVTTTEAANEGIRTYNTTDPYRFNLKLEADIAFLNIGSLPSEYITEDDMSYTLTSYAKLSDLTSYAKSADVETQLNYLWNDCTNTFVDNDELNTALSSYATQTYVADAIANIPLPDLVGYVKSDDTSYIWTLTQAQYDELSINNELNASYMYIISDAPAPVSQSYVATYYVSKDNLNNTLTSYAKSTDLASYVNNGVYDSVNHNILLQNGNTTLATIDASYFIIDGMIDNVYIDNSYLIITFNTDAGKENIEIPLISIFDPSNYYDKTTINTMFTSYYTKSDVNTMFTSYYTKSDVNTMFGSYYDKNDIDSTLASYVTQASLSSNSYVTPNALMSTLAAANYVTHYYLDNQSYVSNDKLDETLSSYATEAYVTNAIENIPTGGGVSYEYLEEQSYVQSSYWDSANEAIAYEFLNNRLAHIDINNQFGNYYTKTETDNRYASTSWADNKFVTIADSENQNQAIAYAISYLNDLISQINQ